MPEIAMCPDATMLKHFMLGESPSADHEGLAGHIEGCPRCLATLKTLTAEDTLVDAVRAQETMPEGVEQEAVRRLVVKVRSMLPAARSPVDRTLDSATPPVSGLGNDTEALGASPDTGDEDDDDGFAPPQAPDELGRLAGYRILELLGVGGMGKVFLAEDCQLHRKVALKVLKGGLARNANSRQRFLQEARLAAAIEHDHIVRIYQVGEDRGIPFLAMQLLNGLSLEEVLKRQGTLKVPQVLRVSIQIAEGLAAAHQQGLIHRDIKPANVWIEPTGGGRVKILDFGLARSTTGDVHLTQSGMILGTPTYMPPEQARGERVDHRCDLYSLGCVMYRMATGELPIKGNDMMSMLIALAMNDPTPPANLRTDLPQNLSDLILSLLAKNKAKRPANAKELVQTLREIERSLTGPATGDTQMVLAPAFASPTAKALPDSSGADAKMSLFLEPNGLSPKTTPSEREAETLAPTPASAAKRGSRGFVPMIALAALFLVVVTGVAAVYQLTFANKDGTLIVEVDEDADVRFKKGKLEIYDETGKRLYTLEPSDKNKTLPPGKYLVKVVGADGVKVETETFEMERKGKAFVKVKAAGPQVVDPKKPDPVNPVGPGTPLALKKATWTPGPADNVLAGLIPRPAILEDVSRWQIVSTVASGPVAWSPDGKWVATTDFDYVRVYDAATGALKSVAKRVGGGSLAGGWLSPDWSADSKWVRYADRRGAGFDQGGVIAVDGTPGVAPWIQHAEADYGWNPKYPLFACMFHGIRDRIQLIDPAQAKPVEVMTKHGPGGKAVWSPDGESLLVVREDKTAQLFGRDGKPGAKLVGVVDPSAVPAWSADSSQIAALVSPTEIGFWKKDGTAGAKTGKHEKAITALYWKPDGKSLAVVASDTKRYFWKPDGTAEGTVDTKSDEPGFTWAKDGKGFFTPGKFWPRIDPSFTQFGKGSHDNVVSPDQTSVTYWSGRETIVNRFENGDAKDIEWKVPQARGGVPTFSSDGKRLAIPDSTGIALNDARDSKKVVRLGGGAAVPPLNAAVFSPKGDRLAIGSQTGHVYLCEATGKILRVIPPTKKADAAVADAISDLRWHPDGKHLVVSTGNITVTIYDTESGKAVASTSLPGATATGMAIFSPANPDHLLIAQPDVSALWRWKLEKEPIQKFPGLGKLLPSPDGKQLLSMRAGGGWYKNDPIPSSLVSMDLKTRDTNWSKAFTTVNSGTVTILWHPDGKHVVAATDGSRTITLRTLDGKVVEEIKPIGLDVTWLYLVGVTAKRNVFVGRIGADVYLCDLSTKKWSLIGKMGGELTVSPDGKHLISVSGNTISYWNLESKALEQIVQLLPDAQHVTLSPAGEVLERSAKAEGFYRYLVEDKNGRILVKTPAEMVLVPSK